VSAAPVTLCVINWNGERYLERTLNAARRSRLRFDEVLLIDNASEDRSLELVRACFPGSHSTGTVVPAPHATPGSRPPGMT
jgi:glycosyltransferase involved in cell wall biosynthesis